MFYVIFTFCESVLDKRIEKLSAEGTCVAQIGLICFIINGQKFIQIIEIKMF